MKSKNGLFCLDWKHAGVKLRGSWKTDSIYTAIDVSVGPCLFSYTDYSGKEHGYRDDCFEDKQDIENWLGSSLNMIAFYNAGFFKQDKFGDESVHHKAAFKMSSIRASKPPFIGATIDHYELEDESALVNLGFVD